MQAAQGTLLLLDSSEQCLEKTLPKTPLHWMVCGMAFKPVTRVLWIVAIWGMAANGRLSSRPCRVRWVT